MFETNDIISVWDKRLIRGVKNYRRLATQTQYKAGRDTERSAKVFSFEEKTTEMLNHLGVKNMYPGILEADDVIWWLSKKIPGEKVIVSVDQDMLQLVDKRTTVYSPIKNVIIDYTNFTDVIGVSIENFLRYKSLMGDKSDNLPGVTRCGKKTAAKLVNECATDSELIEKLGKEALKPYFHNLEMIDLEQGDKHHPEDADIYADQYKQLQSHKPDMASFRSNASSLNMKKLVDDIAIWEDVFDKQHLNKTLADIVNSLGLSK